MTNSSSDGPAIELSGLTKVFGSTPAVDNLSLKIDRGSTFGLLGPNGAGKSTTIKMLMGMLSITAGEARVLGVDVAQNATIVKDSVGYVPETHHIYRWMRVGDVIGFCRALYTTWNDQTCHEMVDLFRLDLSKKVKHLSKGTLVKLALLLAVSHDPQVLVLDEPISGLDPVARRVPRRCVADDLPARSNGVDLVAHAGRRAAAGRYGGYPLRWAVADARAARRDPFDNQADPGNARRWPPTHEPARGHDP